MRKCRWVQCIGARSRSLVRSVGQSLEFIQFLIELPLDKMNDAPDLEMSVNTMSNGMVRNRLEKGA